MPDMQDSNCPGVPIEAGLRGELNRIQERNTELERSNRDLEQFALMASHDLQEPLRGITLYAQLLAEKYAGNDEDTTAFLNYIVNGALRMRDLLASLLSYSELSRTERPPATAVDMNTVLQMVLSDLKIAISDSSAVISYDTLPVVSACTGDFLRVFQNLLMNAIKYRSERPLRVHISSQSAGRDARISVADNGAGIEPSQHREIFTAFTRLHGPKIPGCGLGLTICERLVKRNGGRIWVESTPGKGSTFWFTVPVDSQRS